jgi:hypothetical protein
VNLIGNGAVGTEFCVANEIGGLPNFVVLAPCLFQWESA